MVRTCGIYFLQIGGEYIIITGGRKMKKIAAVLLSVLLLGLMLPVQAFAAKDDAKTIVEKAKHGDKEAVAKIMKSDCFDEGKVKAKIKQKFKSDEVKLDQDNSSITITLDDGSAISYDLVVSDANNLTKSSTLSSKTFAVVDSKTNKLSGKKFRTLATNQYNKSVSLTKTFFYTAIPVATLTNKAIADCLVTVNKVHVTWAGASAWSVGSVSAVDGTIVKNDSWPAITEGHGTYTCNVMGVPITSEKMTLLMKIGTDGSVAAA